MQAHLFSQIDHPIICSTLSLFAFALGNTSICTRMCTIDICTWYVHFFPLSIITPSIYMNGPEYESRDITDLSHNVRY